MAKSPIADPALRARRNSLVNHLRGLRIEQRDLTAALDESESDPDILARFGATYRSRLAAVEQRITRIQTDIAAIERTAKQTTHPTAREE